MMTLGVVVASIAVAVASLALGKYLRSRDRRDKWMERDRCRSRLSARHGERYGCLVVKYDQELAARMAMEARKRTPSGRPYGRPTAQRSVTHLKIAKD